MLQRLLKALRIDVLGERWGLQGALMKAGIKQPLSQIAGRLAFWMVFLVFILMGVDALHLPATTGMMSHLLSFFPHIVAASLLLLVGVLLANFFSEAALIASVGECANPGSQNDRELRAVGDSSVYGGNGVNPIGYCERDRGRGLFDRLRRSGPGSSNRCRFGWTEHREGCPGATMAAEDRRGARRYGASLTLLCRGGHQTN